MASAISGFRSTNYEHDMTRASSRRYVLALSTLLVCASAQAAAHDQADPAAEGRASEPDVPSPLTVPIDAATLAALPREAVTATAHVVAAP